MKYLLDTNIIIEAVGGSPEAVSALKKAVSSEWVGYSAITRLELFAYPDLSADEELAITAVISEINEIAVSRPIIDSAILLRKKFRIKAPDAIIAATAFTVDAVLLTRNTKDFQNLDGIKIDNPWD